LDIFRERRLSPRRGDQSQLLRLPVFTIYTFVRWSHSALVPRDFGHPASAPGEWRER
jgi:hypothetical protein